MKCFILIPVTFWIMGQLNGSRVIKEFSKLFSFYSFSQKDKTIKILQTFLNISSKTAFVYIFILTVLT